MSAALRLLRGGRKPSWFSGGFRLQLTEKEPRSVLGASFWSRAQSSGLKEARNGPPLLGEPAFGNLDSKAPFVRIATCQSSRQRPDSCLQLSLLLAHLKQIHYSTPGSGACFCTCGQPDSDSDYLRIFAVCPRSGFRQEMVIRIQS